MKDTGVLSFPLFPLYPISSFWRKLAELSWGYSSRPVEKSVWEKEVEPRSHVPKPPELLDYSLGRNSEITCEFLTHRNYEGRVYQFYMWFEVSYYTDEWNWYKCPFTGKVPAHDRQTSEDPSKDHGIFLSFIACFQSLFHCINYLHIFLFHWTMKCLNSKMPRNVPGILHMG